MHIFLCADLTAPSDSGVVLIEQQLRDCLHVVGPFASSVTHLKITTWIDPFAFLTIINIVRVFANSLKRAFSSEQTHFELCSIFSLPSSAPSALLVKACPNITHLTVDFGAGKDSLELLGQNCPQITSLHFLSHNGAEDIKQSLPHFHSVTHIKMLFWSWGEERVDLLSAFCASPGLTHLTLGAGSMMSMRMWEALPKGLREIRIGAGLEDRLRWSWWFKLLQEPMFFEMEVELMLGLDLQVGHLTENALNSTQLLCTRVSSNHSWVCEILEGE